MRNDNVLSDDDTSQSDFDSDDSVLDKNYEVSRKKYEIILTENELSDDSTEYSDQQDLPDLPPETFNFSKQTSRLLTTYFAKLLVQTILSKNHLPFKYLKKLLAYQRLNLSLSNQICMRNKTENV